MRAVLAIARREMRSFFVSPAAYVLILVFLSLVSGLFLYLLFQNMVQNISAGPGIRRLTTTEAVLRPFFMQAMRSALFLVTPLISMRLLSEDRKQGTADLLLSSPITTLQLVLGKYIGALEIMSTLFSGYLGIYLTAAMFLAAGTFASAMTENQIVAALLAVAIMAALLVSGFLAEGTSRYLGGILAPFSLQLNLQDFATGIVDSSGIVYFLSMSAFFIFLTQRLIDSQRWR